MRKLLLLFFTFSYFVVASYGQTKTASQTVQDFYKWYTTKGAILEWRNEGGYDPIVQAQDFDDQFKIKALSSSTTKATFELWMFGGKAATVTLNNVANQWLIDDIKGV